MGQYVTRRILQAIPLLILISILMFLLLHALPGGPEAVYDSPTMDSASRAAIRASLGLNDPLPVQYLKWAGSMLTGQFGSSFATSQPVSGIIAQRFPATLELFVAAFVIALLFTFILGPFSALYQKRLPDYIITTITYLGISIPIFLLGVFLQDIFGVSLHWLPTSGTQTLGYTFSPLDTLIDQLLHLVMPALVLAITFIARWSRYLRSSMIDVVKQDYMRTGKAKGVPISQLVIRHALRNAMIPLVTIIAIDFGSVAGGATITEGIFAWPGMGSLFLNSLATRDYPVLLAILMLSAILVISFNLIADILYGIMDPRIRYA